MEEELSYDEGSIVNTYVIAIDYKEEEMLLGLRDGTITHYCSYDAEPAGCKVVWSHSEGEVWGLADGGSDKVVTSGDDNKVMTWSTTDRACSGK
jgi:hypothetical protein